MIFPTCSRCRIQHPMTIWRWLSDCLIIFGAYIIYLCSLFVWLNYKFSVSMKPRSKTLSNWPRSWSSYTNPAVFSQSQLVAPNLQLPFFQLINSDSVAEKMAAEIPSWTSKKKKPGRFYTDRLFHHLNLRVFYRHRIPMAPDRLKCRQVHGQHRGHDSHEAHQESDSLGLVDLL